MPMPGPGPAAGPWEGWQREWGPSCGRAGGAGLLAAAGLPRGARSEPFTAAELLRAVAAAAAAAASGSAGAVWARCAAGGLLLGGGTGGGAALAAAARLARDHTAASLALLLSPHPPGCLTLVLLHALCPGEELLLWPDAALACLARLPALLLPNIAVGPTYVCGSCPAAFSWPHPLKAHLLLRCGAPLRASLLRRLAAAAAAAVTAAGHGAPPVPAVAAADPHRCGVCGKRYSRRYGLKIHLRTHSGHKPLRCAHCPRAFADPSNLNKHRRLHQRLQRRQPQPLPGDRVHTVTAVAMATHAAATLKPLPLGLDRTNTATKLVS